MSLRIETGIKVPAAGWTIKFNEGGGTLTGTITAGKYAPTDLSGITYIGSGNYTPFGTAVATAMNAAGANTYTCTWNASTQDYTIARTAGANVYQIESNPSDDAHQALGFSAATAQDANDKTSDVTPYYVIPTSLGAMSRFKPDYERAGHTEQSVSDNGYPYSVSQTSVAKYLDFVVEREEWAKVHKHKADPSAPWTYEHMWEHCRSKIPFAVFDSNNDDTVHLMHASGAHFDPVPIKKDHLNYWTVEFPTFMLGRL